MEEIVKRFSFQYISCYSLSLRYSQDNISDICFNTSHVILYHCLQSQNAQRSQCFNTSHVILYRLSGLPFRIFCDVSIHLMLFFIKAPLAEWERRGLCFNTSHVILYPELERMTEECLLFQYISCYSLSVTTIIWTAFITSFNTSHVILYPVKSVNTRYI